MNFKIAMVTLGLCFSGSQIAQAADWSGAYFGGQVGSHTLKFNATATDGTTSAEGSAKASGFAGGIYSGYNFQSGNMLYGVEADLDFNNANKNFSDVNGADNVSIDISQKVAGSLRGRLGYVQDNFLVYGAVGIAFSKVTADYNAVYQATTYKGSSSKSLTGLVLGAGVEYALSPSMLLRVAYDYTNYGDLDFSNGKSSASVDTTTHDIKVGVAFKF